MLLSTPPTAPTPHPLFPRTPSADVCAHQLLDGLRGLAQLMQDTSELVLIIFV